MRPVSDEPSRIQFSDKNHRRPGEVLFQQSAMGVAKSGKKVEGQPQPHALDGEEAQAMHRSLMATYRYELDRQAENRADQAMDEDMFDHIQWTDAEVAALQDRGQTPIVFNLIQTTLNWVMGSQRRSPMDYKVLPRRKEGSDAAQRKDELLRHLRDENNVEQQVALAFADAVKVGVGWLETGEGDAADGPIVFDRHESWRNIIWDSRSQRPDLSDARYVCRSKWLDLDVATALWPQRAAMIRLSTEQSMMGRGISDAGDEHMDSIEDDTRISGFVTSGGQHIRKRVRCIEMWFRKPGLVKVVQGGDFSRELFDPWSEGHVTDLMTGRATLVDRPREVVHVALMTERGLLDVRQSPYRHNRFPFTAIWGYRRGRDGMPYGMIRGLRDIQRDLNKRASKALHHLSTVRVSVQEGAVDDIEELRNEAGRPDSVIVHRSGNPAPVITTDTAVAAEHINLMSMDAQMIQQVGGVTDENLGRRTNATSGKAIMARQDQGQLATSLFFDNLRFAQREHGEKKLVNIEQFYTDRQQFRITDSRGNPQYIEINDGSFSNAISMFKADFVLGEEEWRATSRQAQAEQLIDFMGQLAATAPQLVVGILDLVIEATDLPKRDEIVKRIRQETGVDDPDEDPNNPSPEALARQQQKAEAAAMQQRAAEAQIAEQEAKAAKMAAEAARARIGVEADDVSKVKSAIEAMIQLAGAPVVAAAVDQTLGLAAEKAMALVPGAQPAPPPVMPDVPQIPAQPATGQPIDPTAQGMMP